MLATMLLCAGWRGATAQSILGTVVDRETRAPVAAVLVTLVDETGRDRQRAMVGADGLFRFLGLSPGVYALRAERIGAATARVEDLVVEAGDTIAVRIPLTVRPVAIDGIRVEQERRCEAAPERGPDAQRVWDEARKALRAVALTDSLVESPVIGGRVDFRGLPDGTWIVSRWAIRMPIVVEERDGVFGQRRVRLSGVAEEGGRVTRAVRRSDGRVAFAERLGTIVGGVRAPAGHVGRPGARVVVLTTGQSVPLDPTGRFRLTDLPAGLYELAHARPELRGLDRQDVLARVFLDTGDTTAVTLAPPHPDRILARHCHLDRWPPGSSLLRGEVVDTTSGVARADLDLEIRWQEEFDARRGPAPGSVTETTVRVRTDDAGAFEVCGVPRDRRVLVTGRRAGRTLFERSVVIPLSEPVAVFVFHARRRSGPLLEPPTSH